MNQPISSQPIKPIDRGPASLISGAAYPLRALWLLIHRPQLRHYVLMPVLVNLLLGITLYAGLLFLGLGAIDALLSNLPTWTTEASHEVSDLATNLPQAIHLPEWHWSLPAWFPQFPDWQWSLPTWDIRFPNWLPAWNIRWPTWIGNLPDWGFAVFVWLLRLLLIGVLFLITGFILLQFGVFLGAPWYGKLSEEIEKLQTGAVFLIEVNPAIEIARAISYELKKLCLTVGIGLVLVLLNFFVGPGTAMAMIGGVALASMIACMDFLDAAVERRRPRFRQKLAIVFRTLPGSASFGLVCLGLVSIPFVNLLSIPVCVAAGTLFFCDRVLPVLQPSGTINRDI
jgi:CysZ protein